MQQHEMSSYIIIA